MIGAGFAVRSRAHRARMACPPETAGTVVPDLLLIPRASSSSFNKPHRADFGIAAKDRAHDLRFAVVDDELAVFYPITERRHAAHPHPLLLRGGELVADALAHDLALELRKGQQNIQGQAPHRARW